LLHTSPRGTTACAFCWVNPKQDEGETIIRIAEATLSPFIRALFEASGSNAYEAPIVARHLIDASLAGHDSHGLIRAPKYLGWVRQGAVIANRHAEPFIDSGAVLGIDGGFGYGQVIGREAMELAIPRANANGFCMVGIRNSGHLGRIGAWPEQLAAAGLVSLHFVNTSGFGILVAPFGASERRLSANPIAAGAPGPDYPIVLDISTAATAEGKIQVARNKGDRMPPGQMLDGAGKPTDDPEAFYGSPLGAILPFGAHKGSGLSVFCELLAGSLTGGGASNPANPTAGKLVNNMLTLVFNPGVFRDAAGFRADLAGLVTWMRSARPIEPGAEILLPGEIERRTRVDRQRYGIPVDRVTAHQLIEAASLLEVTAPDLLWRVSKELENG